MYNLRETLSIIITVPLSPTQLSPHNKLQMTLIIFLSESSFFFCSTSPICLPLNFPSFSLPSLLASTVSAPHSTALPSICISITPTSSVLPLHCLIFHCFRALDQWIPPKNGYLYSDLQSQKQHRIELWLQMLVMLVFKHVFIHCHNNQ